MCYDAKLAGQSPVLVLSHACGDIGRAIVGDHTLAENPVLDQVRYRRQKSASLHTSCVRNDTVCVPVELQPWGIVSAWATQGLIRCVDRLDCRGITAGRTGIASTGVQSERCELDAHDWVASKHVDEATSIAMARSEESTGINAELAGHVVDQVVDEADVV